MADHQLKTISFSREDLVKAFDDITNAIAVGEANYGTEKSNRVEEDWRIIQKVFGARALVEDIHEQLRPWANAFGFSPREPEEVKLSWSLTVGKAVGICQELMRELSPGWQSRGRIGSNHPNTIDALLEAIGQINTADLDKALNPEAGSEHPETPTEQPEAKPSPKNLKTPVEPAQKPKRYEPLRPPDAVRNK